MENRLGIEDGFQIAEELVRRGGGRLEPADRPVLMNRVDDLSVDGDVVRGPNPRTETTLDRTNALEEAVLLGFWDAAAEGVAFCETAKIENRFGRTIEENYPEAGETFLQVATTFWTLMQVTDELDRDDRSNPLALSHLLSIPSRQYGPLFFPMPAIVRTKELIDADTREAHQRTVLACFAPRIDIEDFIEHNPILIRDRKREARGCLGSLIFL